MQCKILFSIGASCLLFLSACGSSSYSDSGTDQNIAGQQPADQTAVISLTTDTGRSVKTGIGPANLLEPCSAPWPTWSGEPTGIRCIGGQDIEAGGTFSPHGNLLIPAPTGDQQMTVGVRRFDTPLNEGFNYNLSVQADGEASVILFLFNTNGELVPIGGTDSLTRVRPGESLSFVAPANIAGFFLQVQSGWQATEDDVIAPYMPTPSTGGGLVDISGQVWTDWSGTPVESIGFNSLVGHTAVGTPAPGESLRYGIQRYSAGLVEGQQYELSIRSGNAQAWLLLFMFDANGNLISRAGSSWELAIGRPGEAAGSRVFTAPAGVASFAIQIQSEFNATEIAFAYPNLTEFAAAAAR